MPQHCDRLKKHFPTDINSKGSQPWIFTGRADAEAEAPILWPPDWRADSLEKTLMLGKIEDRRETWQQRMRWLEGIIDSMDVNLSKFCGVVKDREAWHAAVHGVSRSLTWLSKWTTTNIWSYSLEPKNITQ